MDASAFEHVIVKSAHGHHRALRVATIVGLALVAVAVATLVAWGFYTRETWEPHLGFADPDRASQSFVGRGLRILMFHPLFEPFAIVAIGGVIGAAGSIHFMIKRVRWAYLVTSIGCAAAIVVPWLAREEVWELELAFSRSAKWAARSPYVGAATTLAIAATVVLALVAIAGALAWKTHPKQPA